MEHRIVSHLPTPTPLTYQVASPQVYLSSAGAGWEGLEALAFLEPRELEGWISPFFSAVAVVLFRGSGMRIETRQANGPWVANSVYDGDLCLRVGWGTPAEYRWKTLSNTGGATRTLHLHLSKDLLARTAEDVAGCDPAHLTMIERRGFQDPLLKQIGLTLWHELEQASPVGRLYAETAAQLLAVHLLRRYTSVAHTIKEAVRGPLTPQQLQRVKDFVQAHLSQDLGLDALAKQTGFSSYHFARLFRQATGESPHQFVLRQRIEQAQRLLEKPDMPLAQVALAAGFAHQSHLAQHFKRQVGLTPSAYRRERSIRTDFEQDCDKIAGICS
ncbi:MAG TPA: AraC family transcriptional regulator [Ktedonobacterales bacterium]